MIKQCQKEYYLLGKGEYRNKSRDPEKTILCLIPGEDGFLARNQSTIE
jgi:hypothetical protein